MKNLRTTKLQRMHFKNMCIPNCNKTSYSYSMYVIAQKNKVQFFKLGSMLNLLFGCFALIRDISKTATYMNILIVETIALGIDFHSNKQVCIAQPLHSFINI
jgi:hypothetical protein